jgi:carboxyl-terminal processing protease
MRQKEIPLNKSLKVILIVIVALILLTGAFSGGFLVGHFLPSASGLTGIVPPTVSSPSPDQQSATPTELQSLFQPFWETWQIVHENYVDQPVDDVALMRGAISGMLSALGDQHTSFMNPDEFQQANESLSGEYEGIGAYVDTSTEYLTVISPISGSPAEAAGLRSGDAILAIDGKDMTGIDPELVRKQVLGPAGSVVTLTIRRGDAAPFDVEITRAKITIKSADGKMLENNIAYVQVTTFGDKTTPELQAALETLMAQNPQGLILDLRNNGGGYLQTAVEVASQFLPKDKVVLYEQYGNGERQEYKSLGEGLATDIPMVVLTNEGTASASEIVAGALQDYGRATLVGVVSYGKGSVQIWTPLSNDQGAVRVTVAKWLTPDERTIHKIGLTPDVEVKMTEEDINAKRDPQLDVASQALLHLIAGTSFTYEAPQASSTPVSSPPSTSTSITPTPITPSLTMPDVVECPLAMPAHLISGQAAKVTIKLNLRSSPGIQNNLIQVVSPNTQVNVIGNPTCVPHSGLAYIWWQVRLPNGTIGWLAEGSITGKFYFLELVKK